jgi:hypothetical protein
MRPSAPGSCSAEPSMDEGNVVRMLAITVVCIGCASVTHGAVWGNVYRHDGKTPLALLDPNTPGIYSDIMVGTHLVLVVESDAGGYWWGALEVSWQDWERGTLAGRGYDPDGMRGFEGSCLEAAGTLSIVDFFEYPHSVGFQLTTHHRTAVAGDWFLLDYHAEETGPCDVRLYDYAYDLDMPIQTLSFTHVPSRDFDGDTLVNFADFALLASRWRQPAEIDPNTLTVCDIDRNGLVDAGDISLFCEYWLERTDFKEPAVETSASVTP